MNTKLKEVFQGKIVNKAHTINTGVDEFPRADFRILGVFFPSNFCDSAGSHFQRLMSSNHLSISCFIGIDHPGHTKATFNIVPTSLPIQL